LGDALLLRLLLVAGGALSPATLSPSLPRVPGH